MACLRLKRLNCCPGLPKHIALNLTFHGLASFGSYSLVGLNQKQESNRFHSDGKSERQSRKQTTCIDMRMPHKDDCLQEVLHILNRMDQEGIPVHLNTYLFLLQGCINMKALEEGKRVHAHIRRTGFEPNTFLGNNLINMYVKCGSMVDARKVFEEMHNRDVVSWNAMFSGYAKHGHGEEVLKLFWRMQEEGMKPNRVTFLSIVKACASLASLEKGKQIHAHIVEHGFESDLAVSNSLVDMYAKCGSVINAHRVFEKITKRNVVSWNAMIAGYSQHGHGEEAIRFFWQMQREGLDPNEVTFIFVLKACASLGALDQGKQIHSHIIQRGFESNVIVGNTLVNMYAKCESIVDAREVFDRMPIRSVVSWNVMIAGYAQLGHSGEAIRLFYEMQQEGLKPNEVTFVGVLEACANLEALELGKKVHAYIMECGCEANIFVACTLINMYAKCGSVEDARQLFDKMPNRDVASWNAMIAGYSQHDFGQEAVKLFRRMHREGVKPNEFTFVSVFNACARLAALEQGKQIHAYMMKSGFKANVFVCNALVDMYAKCGSVVHARQIFDKMPIRDVISWNAMIAAYAQNGPGEEALKLFLQLQQEGVKPNKVTFVGILSSCNHAGLVDEGCLYFVSMCQVHSMSPAAEHYACLVDLLGRAGRLAEADHLIQNMPFQPSAAVWTALLGASRNQGNVELAKHAAESLLELKPHNSAAFVLLSNIYAAAGKWDDKADMRRMMGDKLVKKKPGYSHIEVKGQVHFFINDTVHPQFKEIFAELTLLHRKLDDEGYIADTRFTLFDVDDEQNEFPLHQHTERLALAFGLVNISPGTPIHIIKNLQVCGDCHSATKFISKIMRRDIVIRDANCFHHFKNGVCSCGDYW